MNTLGVCQYHETSCMRLCFAGYCYFLKSKDRYRGPVSEMAAKLHTPLLQTHCVSTVSDFYSKNCIEMKSK